MSGSPIPERRGPRAKAQAGERACIFYAQNTAWAAALRTDENKAFWRRDSMQKLFEKSLRKPLDIIKMKWYIVITLKKG